MTAAAGPGLCAPEALRLEQVSAPDPAEPELLQDDDEVKDDGGDDDDDDDDTVMMLTDRCSSWMDPAGWASHRSAFPALVAAASNAVHGSWMGAAGSVRDAQRSTAAAVRVQPVDVPQNCLLLITMRQWAEPWSERG